ncbi:MAG: fumarylacetoacetate hydrolase family protein [Candidatus Omnitrophota bacterium]
MRLVRFRYQDSIYKGHISGDEVVIDVPGADAERLKLEEVSLLAPVEPSKIISVGLNYKDHAEELGMPLPQEPVIFIKPSTSVIGPGDVIVDPRAATRVDYEAELAVVIKDKARNVTAKDAPRYIAGYTCFNDVTARDIQKKDVQWSRAKSFDTFAPVGPWVETDIDPGNLRIKTLLNGKIKQDSSTAEFIYSVPELVSFVSGIMTLLPGDVISTGTPPNVGPMKPGDEVIVEIEGIGQLKNKVELE